MLLHPALLKKTGKAGRSNYDLKDSNTRKNEIETHFVDFKLNILAAKGYQLPFLPELHNDFLKDSMKNSAVR